MPTLTYPSDLGDAVQVGQPLGCDSLGWPYRVEDVTVVHADKPATLVTVEPWPIPGPTAGEDEKLAYAAAMQHAIDRAAGVIR